MQRTKRGWGHKKMIPMMIPMIQVAVSFSSLYTEAKPMRYFCVAGEAVPVSAFIRG